MVAFEDTSARNAVWVIGSGAVVLMTGILRDELTIADLALPILACVSSASVDVVLIAIVGRETTITRVTVRHAW